MREVSFWKSEGQHAKGRIAVAVLLGAAICASCTSGNLCNVDHPCPSDWACLTNDGQPSSGEGRCGERHDTPLCDTTYCTRRCTHNTTDGTPAKPVGDCVAPFVDCSEGGFSVGTAEVCKANGVQTGLTACSSAADCAGAAVVEWME